MRQEDLYKRLIPKDRNLGEIASEAAENTEIISFLLNGVQETNPRVKYGCLNSLVIISENNPKLIYPHFDSFAEYLDSDKNIMKLGCLKILSHLSRVDDKNKFDSIFDRFYSFITDPGMTTAASVSKASATIAAAKHYLAQDITRQLLKVARTDYKTEECKNILIGHVISCFDKMLGQIDNKKPVLTFVELNTNNPWKATRTKAQKFIKKHA